MDIQIADDRPELLDGLKMGDVVVQRLEGDGPLLDKSYELFERVFDPAVLDSEDTYNHRMSPECRRMRDYLPCYTVATVARGDSLLVLGFVSSDVMWIAGDESAAFHAVGNIATSPLAKELGVRGIGSALLDAATAIAAAEARQDGKTLLCVATEAEPASLGFWKKQGFLWPTGCHYLQPPLEFDEAGKPLYDEVPETLLLKPVAITGNDVSPKLVRGVIEAIYENWCLRGWRGELSDDAMQRAESYVMQHVLGKVLERLPDGPMPLTDDIPAAPR